MLVRALVGCGVFGSVWGSGSVGWLVLACKVVVVVGLRE